MDSHVLRHLSCHCIQFDVGNSRCNHSPSQVGHNKQTIYYHKKCNFNYKEIAFHVTHSYVIIVLCYNTLFMQAVSTTYKASDMCDSPAKDYGWIDPGIIHTVTMDR